MDFTWGSGCARKYYDVVSMFTFSPSKKVMKWIQYTNYVNHFLGFFNFTWSSFFISLLYSTDIRLIKCSSEMLQVFQCLLLNYKNPYMYYFLCFIFSRNVSVNIYPGIHRGGLCWFSQGGQSWGGGAGGHRPPSFWDLFSKNFQIFLFSQALRLNICFCPPYHFRIPKIRQALKHFASNISLSITH